jgi:hypothetical protein
MNYKVVATPSFLVDVKRLSKKYPSLKIDIAELAVLLSANPTTGTPLGKDAYKIRLAITSKGKGKSGGARVITCIKVIRAIVYLVSIFDKSEKENITDKELKELLKAL